MKTVAKIHVDEKKKTRIKMLKGKYAMFYSKLHHNTKAIWFTNVNSVDLSFGSHLINNSVFLITQNCSGLLFTGLFFTFSKNTESSRIPHTELKQSCRNSHMTEPVVKTLKMLVAFNLTLSRL